MRQVALIALLASIGSYVPARRCRLGPLDAIHTRIGAADDLANAQSTFMLEMTEAAAIVHAATEQSLVLMDEIGRGTSTFDGLALAGAIASHLHEKNRAFTLFATHYFELTALPEKHAAAHNVHVSAVESGATTSPSCTSCKPARPAAATACRWPAWPACPRPCCARRARRLESLEAQQRQRRRADRPVRRAGAARRHRGKSRRRCSRCVSSTWMPARRARRSTRFTASSSSPRKPEEAQQAAGHQQPAADAGRFSRRRGLHRFMPTLGCRPRARALCQPGAQDAANDATEWPGNKDRGHCRLHGAVMRVGGEQLKSCISTQAKSDEANN
jgi:hypothetical protein